MAARDSTTKSESLKCCPTCRLSTTTAPSVANPQTANHTSRSPQFYRAALNSEPLIIQALRPNTPNPKVQSMLEGPEGLKGMSLNPKPYANCCRATPLPLLRTPGLQSSVFSKDRFRPSCKGLNNDRVLLCNETNSNMSNLVFSPQKYAYQSSVAGTSAGLEEFGICSGYCREGGSGFGAYRD